MEGKDRQLSGFLEVLVSYHGISKLTIEKMAGVEENDIDRLLANPPEKIEIEVKYKIAVTVMEGVSQTILKKVIVVLLKISRMIKSKCTFRFSGCSWGVRLNMENGFLLRLTLPFPVKKSVITIPVSAVSLPGSLAIRKFWLMSQPQKKSMVKNACFQYDFSRRTADFLCMAGKSTIESDRQ